MFKEITFVDGNQDRPDAVQSPIAITITLCVGSSEGIHRGHDYIATLITTTYPRYTLSTDTSRDSTFGDDYTIHNVDFTVERIIVRHNVLRDMIRKGFQRIQVISGVSKQERSGTSLHLVGVVSIYTKRVLRHTIHSKASVDVIGGCILLVVN